jgi:uncharacterized damage-inducible protein DinB
MSCPPCPFGMADADDYRRLFAYNRRVFERFLRAVGELSWEEASRPRGAGHESLTGTLLHILGVYEGWLGYILTGRAKELQAFRQAQSAKPSPHSHAAIRRESDRVWRMVTRTLRNLTDEELQRRVRAPWMPGFYTVEDALWQTTLEEAHHIGEIIALFWQMDRRPPQMVWILNRPPLRPSRGGRGGGVPDRRDGSSPVRRSTPRHP